MTTNVPTLRTLFELPSEDDPDRLPDGWKPFREKLGEEVKGIKWKASMPDLTVKIAELLDVEVPTLFVATWKKAAEVKKKLAESREKPADVIDVELAEHTISTSHSPYITVQFGKAPVKTLKFTVTASFTLSAFVLKLQNGEVREMRSGHCQAEGKLEGLGLLLAEKKLSPLTFPGTIPIAATP
jgi:hypothetical protein